MCNNFDTLSTHFACGQHFCNRTLQLRVVEQATIRSASWRCNRYFRCRFYKALRDWEWDNKSRPHNILELFIIHLLRFTSFYMCDKFSLKHSLFYNFCDIFQKILAKVYSQSRKKLSIERNLSQQRVRHY